MAEIWRGMTFEEKKPYVLLAKQERQRYKREMEEYKRYLEREKRLEIAQPPIPVSEKLPLLAPRQQKNLIPNYNIDNHASHPDVVIDPSANLDQKFTFETDKNQYFLKSHPSDKYSMSAVITKWKFINQSSSDFDEDSNQEDRLHTSGNHSPKLSGNISPKLSGTNSVSYSGYNSPYLLPNSGSNSPRLPIDYHRRVTVGPDFPYLSTAHSGSNSPKQGYYSPKIVGSPSFVSSNLSNDDFLSPLSPLANLSLSKNSIESSTTTRHNSLADYGRVSSFHSIGGKTTAISPAASNTGMDQTQLRRTSSPNILSASNQTLHSTSKPQRRLKKSITSESPIYEDVRTDFPASENNLAMISNEDLVKPPEIRIPSQETVREESSPVKSAGYDFIAEVDYTPVDNSFTERDE
ncbi:hypothetical protein HK103_005037 [Boothiomyces macroporosus]|uniref:HMG box domain-containing protein n=1 Tax=Boothiomyces macroporosus TaxID=261099 RepID=A0AAD5Y3M4_9FUNG|nr:hypothetical protein HK103_005037 [Boothiomyces macroporosus]